MVYQDARVDITLRVCDDEHRWTEGGEYDQWTHVLELRDDHILHTTHSDRLRPLTIIQLR